MGGKQSLWKHKGGEDKAGWRKKKFSNLKIQENSVRESEGRSERTNKGTRKERERRKSPSYIHSHLVYLTPCSDQVLPVL